MDRSRSTDDQSEAPSNQTNEPSTVSFRPLTSILTSTKKRAAPDLANASEATKTAHDGDDSTFLCITIERVRDVVEMLVA
jgi:hypothetical protein